MKEGQPSNERYLIEVLLRLAEAEFVAETSRALGEVGVVEAVARRDTSAIFDWIVSLLPLQGISDAAAMRFQREHGQIAWTDAQDGLRSPLCPRLRSWWHFQCGYRKASHTCMEPDLIDVCALPNHDLRKGVLNEAAFGLALFVRDVCNGDLVAWIDEHLARADVASNPSDRGRGMARALVEPLAEIPGTGPKVWNMLVADLLLASDPERERWVTAGASMIAVDTLVHGWLHRTGTLRQHGAEHPYGPGCYGPTGCAAVIERLAQTVDARAFSPAFPSYFPRFVQVAVWEFCAEAGRNICNGNQIDDRYPCRQVFCPAHSGCERRALHPL